MKDWLNENGFDLAFGLTLGVVVAVFDFAVMAYLAAFAIAIAHAAGIYRGCLFGFDHAAASARERGEG